MSNEWYFLLTMQDLFYRRDRYHEVRRKWEGDFDETIAGGSLKIVNQEIERRLVHIDISELYEVLKSGK